MLHFASREHTRCTKEEKLSCLPLIDEMVSIATIARKEGLLAFDRYAATCESALLRAGLELAADGVDKFTIKDCLEDMIQFSDTTWVELLRQFIMANWILGIMNGDNPRILRKSLTAHLGEEVYGEVMKPEKKEADFIDTINNTAKWMEAVKEFLTVAEKAADVYDIMSADNDVLAYLLLYLEPDLSLKVFETLDNERRVAIIKAMAAMDYTRVNLAAEIKSYLHPWKMLKWDGLSLTEQNNIKRIAGLLRAAPPKLYNEVMDDIEKTDEELYKKIKDNVIVFEDIAGFDDTTIRRILREVNNADLAVALKMSSDDVKRAIFSNISSRLCEMLADDMEVMGDMNSDAVEAAQQKIVEIIRKLDCEGDIIVANQIRCLGMY